MGHLTLPQNVSTHPTLEKTGLRGIQWYGVNESLEKLNRSVFYLKTSWEKIKSFGKLSNKLLSPTS